MKTKTFILALALALSHSAMAQESKGECDAEQIERSPNPIIEIITIPFKVVAAMTFGPRCIISNIPKNPPQE